MTFSFFFFLLLNYVYIFLQIKYFYSVLIILWIIRIYYCNVDVKTKMKCVFTLSIQVSFLLELLQKMAQPWNRYNIISYCNKIYFAVSICKIIFFSNKNIKVGQIVILFIHKHIDKLHKKYFHLNLLYLSNQLQHLFSICFRLKQEVFRLFFMERVIKKSQNQGIF